MITLHDNAVSGRVAAGQEYLHKPGGEEIYKVIGVSEEGIFLMHKRMTGWPDSAFPLLEKCSCLRVNLPEGCDYILVNGASK